MGFFSDLKEDLNQAVTELNPEAEEATAETKEEETKLDMEALLDNIDLPPNLYSTNIPAMKIPARYAHL